ncbi:unnamed protein product [Durusdinium trenchii]|uniref:Uncharacterized protein n=1 Tax=Durusdinium trenchii TaxID=1381693 RepID=A0ABP0Q8M5_9DINO
MRRSPRRSERCQRTSSGEAPFGRAPRSTEREADRVVRGRLSVGIEDAQDLILDLEQAIKVASGELCSNPHGGFDSEFQDLPVVPRIEGKPIIQDDDLSTRAPSALLKISGEASSDASGDEEHSHRPRSWAGLSVAIPVAAAAVCGLSLLRWLK